MNNSEKKEKLKRQIRRLERDQKFLKGSKLGEATGSALTNLKNQLKELKGDKKKDSDK